MASIPTGVILIWTGTNASIPSGWVRETSLDGKFPKAAAASTEANVTGGSDTHSHTSPAHSHTMNSHSHSGDTTRNGDGENTDNTASNAARDQHIHSYNISGVSGGTLSDAISYQSTSSLPPYHEVIFIKPNATPKPLENGIVALFNDTSLPSGWNWCDGLNSTPDLRNKYLRGAGAGADAGTTGGATSHSHTVNHTHSGVTHTHSGTSGGNSDGCNKIEYPGGGGPGVVCNHTHTITLNANSAETGDTYSGTAGSAETVEPAYKKIGAIKNNSGAPNKPRGIIGMWLGLLSAIPQGWFLCNGSLGTPDMRDKHLKVASTTGEHGNTGGANTHSHAASNSHSHTQGGTHTHTGSASFVSSEGGTGVSSQNVSQGHSHGLASVSSATSSWAASTIQADSSNNEPAYRTVQFIQFQRELQGGAFFFGLLN